MGSYSEEEEEEGQFFDSREEISSVSDLGSVCFEDCSSGFDFDNSVSNSSPYDIWIKNPESVRDRRRRFLKWMGFSLDPNSGDEKELKSDESSDYEGKFGIDGMVDNSGAVLRTSGFEDGPFSSQSLMSSESNGARGSFENVALEKNFLYKIKNLDDGTEFVVDELDQDGMLSRLHEVGSNQSISFEEFQRVVGMSPLTQRLLSRYVDEARDVAEENKKAKRSWLRKLRPMEPIVDRQPSASSKANDLESTVGAGIQRVKVHSSSKRSKELSSLYSGQEFLAHKGSILTMKFSLDGQYLASGGEDGVVRVWKVIEVDRSDQIDVSASDPSCLYFTMNHLSKLTPLDVDKKKIDKMKRHRSSDSPFVVLPPKAFKVLEKPLHEFQGHSDEVLDLAWSKKGFLLSSSCDKTVRLWQVGCERCLRVFSHNNYVTCVDFNPVDDNYFISGSIDGKVRIWEVLRCKVVDYTDIREIVTAVCYRPGGKGGIVGSMTGNCLFYDITNNQLQLDAQVCLQGKRKVPGKRITSFEFSPSDPSKVVVTSADSLVRVLFGMDVIFKFRASGIRIAANQIFATFTSDGKHIISTSDDSNVYIWDYPSQQRTSRVKNIYSYESFTSKNATIAIPWCGIGTAPGTLLSPSSRGDMLGSSGENGQDCKRSSGELDGNNMLSSPDCFSLTRGFLWEALTRGSATWPEEKLPDSIPVAVSPTKTKSDYKFLKSACQSMFSSHMWGLVIVTAGWDGRIRTYLNYGLPLRL